MRKPLTQEQLEHKRKRQREAYRNRKDGGRERAIERCRKRRQLAREDAPTSKSITKMTLEECGALIGISYQAVRDSEKRALEKFCDRLEDALSDIRVDFMIDGKFRGIEQ